MSRRPGRYNNRCHAGHEMTEKNTYTRPSGHTVCKKCAREDWRRYYYKRLAKRPRQDIVASGKVNKGIPE